MKLITQKVPWLTIMVWSLNSVLCSAQTRPNTTINTDVNGICIGCSVQNPDNAWDSDTASYAVLDLGAVSTLGAYAEATYGFQDSIPLHDVLSLYFSISGTPYSLVSADLFECLLIRLKDKDGNTLETYSDGNLLEVQILNASTNYFRFDILIENESTSQVLIRAGTLLSADIFGRDIHLHDIQHNVLPTGDCNTVVSKPVNDYINGDVLATLNSPENTFSSASVLSGALPSGSAIVSDEIVVTDNTLLVAGTYDVEILIEDNTGLLSSCQLELVINNQDVEAVYTIADALPANDYNNNDILASVTDDNGDIVAATLVTGTLPNGTTLAADGTITVSDASLMTNGDYTVEIETTDEFNGTTTSEITITINPDDIEAVYTVEDAYPANDYQNGATLASATDGNGDIVEANLVSGSLPAGTTLQSDGTISVTDSTLLTDGDFTIEIETTDELNGTTTSEITLTINPDDIEAVYTVEDAYPANDYLNGATLASVTDGNGDIIEANLVSGSLPAGTMLLSDGTITIADSTLLTDGDFTIEIETTDELNGTTTSEITLTINPDDIEAVYTVEDAYPANDYQNGATLASGTDANGDIVEANLVSGSLPAGTTLQSDGTITVADSTLLTDGDFTIEIETTDELNGTTTSEITITINPDDIEAVYTVEDAYPANDYQNGAALASVTDGNGDIVEANLVSGSLPAGTTLQSDGTITVTDSTLLTDGDFTIEIETTDELNGTTTSEITLSINPDDIEAVYTVEDAYPANDYQNGATLASVTDGNGDIVEANLVSGSLPAGSTLQSDGTITVADSTLLTDGDFTIEIETTDELNGMTTSEITITINPDDIEAVYTLEEAYPANDYQNGATLASVTDGNGDIVEANLVSGSLPAGTTLQSDGTIIVSDSTLLNDGEYIVEIATTDEFNGTTTSEITISINPDDDETAYTVKEHKPVNDYQNGEILASATDSNGDIVTADVISGSLPPGTTLQSDGTITVTDSTLLTEGNYSLEIKTTDAFKGQSLSVVEITINPEDVETTFDLATAKPANDYTENEVLATPTDQNGDIIDARIISGNLPDGTSLGSDGILVITDPELITQGTYEIEIETTDEFNGKSSNSLSVTIHPDDIEALYTVKNPKPVNDYIQNEILATVEDENGDIISVEITSGELPPGTAIGATGNVIVNDSTALVAGIYSLGITTRDEFNGVSFNNLLITINGPDQEAIYAVNPAKPVGEYVDDEVIATVSDGDGDIVSAVIISGTLPSGIALNASSGGIFIDDTSQLTAGSTTLFIETTDENGGSTTSRVDLVINEANDTDREATYTISTAKPANQYLQSDTLALASDADGLIVNSSIIAGDLPDGCVLNSNGNITVSNPDVIAEGTYPLTIVTEDETGGTTTHNISLVILEPFITSVVVGLAQSVSTPIPDDGGYTMTFTLTLVSYSNIHVPNVQVTSNLSEVFPSPASFTISDISTTGHLVFNPNFDGSADINLLDDSSEIAIGEKQTISFNLWLDPNGSGTQFFSSSTVIAGNSDNTITSTDTSHNGSDPDPNQDGNPSGEGEDQPTVIDLSVKPLIGAAITATAPQIISPGNYEVTYTIFLENFGNESLTNVQIEDALNEVFGSSVNFSIKQITSAGLDVNTEYNGDDNILLLSANNTLPVNGTAEIALTVNLQSQQFSGPFINIPKATAIGMDSGEETSDLAAGGSNPDPNGNGDPTEPDENGGISIQLQVLPVVGVAKSLNRLTLVNTQQYEAEFVFVIQNHGNTQLTKISVYDDLGLVFGSHANFEVTGLSNSGSLVVNENYNGTSVINLLEPLESTLNIGETDTIYLSMSIAPIHSGVYYNSALAVALNTDESLSTSDLSNDGINPDPNGNNNPNEQGENIPTPISLHAIPIVGVANHANDPVVENNSATIDFIVSVTNYGNDLLETLSLKSNLGLTFGTIGFEIETAPYAENSGITVNDSFDGRENQLLVTDGTLAVGETKTIKYTVRVNDPDANGTFYNTVIASSTGASTGQSTTDVSHKGLTADPNLDGNPIEDDPTSFILLTSPVALGVLNTSNETLEDCALELSFEIRAKNYSDQSLTNLEIQNPIAEALGTNSYAILDISSESGHAVNQTFNGSSDLNILQNNNSLEQEEVLIISYTIRIEENSFNGEFVNNSILQAKYSDIPVSSVSHALGENREFIRDPDAVQPLSLKISQVQHFIPEGFSPNGDNIQDYFEIHTSCGVSGSLTVYNRWGDKVYHSPNYKNDWDGRANIGPDIGKALPDAVYFYHLKLSNSDRIQGFVVLKR